MGSYVQSTLGKEEEVKYEAQVTKWVLLFPSILAFFAFLLVLGFGYPGFGLLAAVLIVLPNLLYYLTSELAVTNKRVAAKYGFISRQTVELSLAKVESVQVHQSIFGRIFNFGTIIVSGAGNPQAPIRGISQPLLFRKAVYEVQEEVLGKHS
ncbi:MAG: PH domain-containing protein [Pseudomonadota bacterium]